MFEFAVADQECPGPRGFSHGLAQIDHSLVGFLAAELHEFDLVALFLKYGRYLRRVRVFPKCCYSHNVFVAPLPRGIGVIGRRF